MGSSVELLTLRELSIDSILVLNKNDSLILRCFLLFLAERSSIVLLKLSSTMKKVFK